VIRFEWTSRGDTKIFSLIVRKLGKFNAQSLEMAGGDLLIQLLGQHVDSDGVLARVQPQVQLSQDLVGE